MRPAPWNEYEIARTDGALHGFCISKERKSLQIRTLWLDSAVVEKALLVFRKQNPTFAAYELRKPCVSTPNIQMKRRNRPSWANEDPRINQPHEARKKYKPVEKIL